VQTFKYYSFTMSHAKTFNSSRVAQRQPQQVAMNSFHGAPIGQRQQGVLGKALAPKRSMQAIRSGSAMKVYAVKDGAVLDRPLRVAVIGGGPSGACTAETLAKGGIETFLIERKMDNCKVGSRLGSAPPTARSSAPSRRPCSKHNCSAFRIYILPM
jgi:hypothetical protein